MNKYEFLRKYSYNHLLDCENDKSNIHRHCFLPLDVDDEDEEFDGSRTNAIESLKENNRLSFMEASEHDFFEISLEDESIWIFGRKIANSLAEFIRKEFETPDYHYDDFQD